MNDSGEERIWTAFTRQRRSVIVASLVLLFYESSGIRIEELSLLGNTFPIQRPSLVPVSLWAAYLYFLMRYYQYFRDLPKREFAEAWEKRFDQVLSTLTRSTFVARYKLEQGAKGTPVFKISEVTPVAEGPGDWHFEVKGSVQYGIDDVHRARSIERAPLTLKRQAILRARVRAWLYVALHTRVATEYLFPFVVAASPVVVAFAMRVAI